MQNDFVAAPMQKLIVLGDSGVGKTNLLSRFVKNKYSPTYKASMGVDFLTKDVALGDDLVTCQLWDTAGQERYQSLGTAFYRGSDACVLVYDVTNARSFARVCEWREAFLAQAAPPAPETFPFLLLGNKCDTDSDRHMITERKAVAWCEEHGGIHHFRVSAKDGTNVEQAFLAVVKAALQRRGVVGGLAEPDVFIPDLISEPGPTGKMVRPGGDVDGRGGSSSGRGVCEC